MLNAFAGQKGQYYSNLYSLADSGKIPLKDGISRDVTSFCDLVTGLRYRYMCAPFGLSASPPP
jgi:hypothetical protein